MLQMKQWTKISTRLLEKLQVCKKTNGGEEKEFWRQVVSETFRHFSGDKDIDPFIRRSVESFCPWGLLETG